MNLCINIEINGQQITAGHICGSSCQDARFSYDENYLASPGARAISISLPLRSEEFSPAATRNFFDGLLPEAFSRREAARQLGIQDDDYIGLLAALGKECIGALCIIEKEQAEPIAEQACYEKITLRDVRKFAKDGASAAATISSQSRLSLAGATGKTGLYYDEKRKKWHKPIGLAPSTHIVKQSHVRLSGIVINEMLSLDTAEKLGIETAERFIVNVGEGNDDEIIFATKRYDRKPGHITTEEGLVIPHRLHQEDFAQALGIYAYDKYELPGQNYARAMFDVIRNYCKNPISDQEKLLKVIIYDHFIGNADNHVKNHSLLYDEKLNSISLAPAYDILSTICYENNTKNMSINIGGEYDINKANRESFRSFAKQIGIGEKIVLEIYDDMKANFAKALKESSSRLQDIGYSKTKDFEKKIIKRFKTL